MTTPDMLAPPKILVPLGSHFFTPEALQKYAQEVQDEHPGKTKVLKLGVDNDGANVAFVMGNHDGSMKFTTAFSHTATGDNIFGASGSFAFD